MIQSRAVRFRAGGRRQGGQSLNPQTRTGSEGWWGVLIEAPTLYHVPPQNSVGKPSLMDGEHE